MIASAEGLRCRERRLLQHGHRVVELDTLQGVALNSESAGAPRTCVVGLVEGVDEFLQGLNRTALAFEPSAPRGPVARMKILDDVPAAIGQQWEQDAQLRNDIIRLMAAVIDDEINAAHLLDHPTEKSLVGLRAHAYLG